MTTAAHRQARMYTMDLAKSPEWWPFQVVSNGGALEFVRVDRQALSDSAFLDHRMELPSMVPETVDVTDFMECVPERPAQPANYLFHTSFSGSTLLARLLDEEGKCLSLKEPHVLAQLANAKRAANGGAREPIADGGLKRGFDLFANLIERSRGDEGVLVKPTNLANNLVPDLMRRGGRAIFLYNPLEDFLRSMIRAGEPARNYLRGLATALIRDGELVLDMKSPDAAALTDLQIGTLAWIAQLDMFRRSMDRYGPDRAASLDFATVLRNPGDAVAGMANFYWPDQPERWPSPELVERKLRLDSKSGGAREAEKSATPIEASEQALVQELLSWLAECDPAAVGRTPLPHDLMHSAVR